MVKCQNKEGKLGRMRNQKGEGSVYQLSNGKWLAKVTRDGRVKTKTVKTEREAIKWLEKLKKEFRREERIAKVNLELEISPIKLSTEAVFRKFLKYKKTGRRKISETSLMRLTSTIEHHILSCCGQMPFLSLTKRDIEGILDKMFEKGLSYSSVKKVYDAFSGCFNFAVYVEKLLEVQENPMLSVSMIPESQFCENKEVEIYDPDEVERFKTECLRKDSQGRYVYKYGRLFVLLLQTGLREGEVCALKKSDVDLNNNTIKITKTAITIKYEPENDIPYWDTKIQMKPKTERSRRIIPLNKTAQKMVRLILEEFPEGDQFIYTSNHRIVAPASLNKYIATINKKAGIENKSGVHKLRDTFGSLLFDKGMDLQTVSDLLGHSSSKVTEKHYLKILEKRKMRAVKMIEI